MPEAAAAAQAEDTDVRRASLTPGRWYAAAIDTSPFSVTLALDTIEERLTQDLHIGSLRIFQRREDVPADVPSAVRDAQTANVWVTGQYNGTGGEAPVPPQVLVIAEYEPPGAAQPTPGTTTPEKGGGEIVVKKDAKKDEISTKLLVAVAVGSTVIIGGGVALLMWLRKRAKKRKNGKKKKRAKG